MARRIIAFAGFLAVLALALTLLWRVYVHHERAAPFAGDEPEVVARPLLPSGAEKISAEIR